MEEVVDGFGLKSTCFRIWEPAPPVLIIFVCPKSIGKSPKFPKRFSREKRKKLRANWIIKEEARLLAEAWNRVKGSISVDPEPC